jgi:hypothetical protein
MRKKFIILNGILLGLLIINCGYAADTIKTKSFSLPINIDYSSYVKSTMYLRYSFEDYNEPYEEFITKVNSPVARQFKKVLQDIRDQNIPKDIVLSSRTKVAKGLQALDVYKKFMSEYNRILSVNNAGQNFDKIKVTKEIYIGNDYRILWELNSVPEMKGGIFRGSFEFNKNSQGDLVWEVGVSDEISSLTGETTKSKSYKYATQLDNIKCDYEYAIPGTTTGYPVYLQFNGKPCDFNVMDSNSNDEVLAFYQKTCRLLVQNPKLLADFYTEQSAKWYRSVIEKDPNAADPYARQREIVRQGRKVVFLLNADPVFIVFYQPFKNPKKDFSDVQYEFIIRDSKDNQLKLTNYSSIASMSQFLDNKSLFIEPFLKPLLEKAKNKL